MFLTGFLIQISIAVVIILLIILFWDKICGTKIGKLICPVFNVIGKMFKGIFGAIS